MFLFFFFFLASILSFFSGLLSTCHHFSLNFFMGTHPSPYTIAISHFLLSFVQGLYMTPLWSNLPISVDSQIHVSFELTNLCPALNSKYAKQIFPNAPKVVKLIVPASFPFCISVSVWGTTIYMDGYSGMKLFYLPLHLCKVTHCSFWNESETYCFSNFPPICQFCYYCPHSS